MLTANANGDLGFHFEVRQNGEVAIFHRQRLAATLRGQAAQQFVVQANESQMWTCSKSSQHVTGNYRRGNEHTAG